MVAIATADTDRYRQDLDRLAGERHEPDWLYARRRAALEHFDELGIPSTHREAWRFTDVSALTPIPFARAGDIPVDAALLAPAMPCYRLVFVNGRYAPGLSQRQTLPKGALVTSLERALLAHPQLVEACLGRLKGLDDHPFTALNTALWEDGAFVWLPRGVVLDTPLHLVFFASGEQTASYPRNLIVMEEASQAVVVEDYRGDGRYLVCPVTEIHTKDGAVLDYHKVQEEDLNAWHLAGMRVCQERDSRITGYMVSSGGRLARTDIFALLNGEGVECSINGLTLVTGGQLGDYHIRVEHAKPHGYSRQLFKGVLEGKSRAVFDGLIHVHKDAQKTVAMQNNRNLLLSRQALANSNPRLEILADDVKCSHGSTVGYLDPDALFYLRSRGIDEAEARAMLVYAFANDSIEPIRWAPLRERLEKLLIGRLYPNAARKSA